MRTSASGPVLYAFHSVSPVAALSAASQPRTPNSPPELPTSTLFFATKGAIVSVSPWLKSASFTFQRSLPVLASIAMVCPSSVLKNRLPFPYVAPRLTTSQHAAPWDDEDGLGR